jgi:hypothetical protein
MTHAELSETPRRIAGLVVPTVCGIAGGASDCRLQSNETRRAGMRNLGIEILRVAGFQSWSKNFARRPCLLPI